jgi:hypothetical protein
MLPQFFSWLCLVVWGLAATFLNLPQLLYEVIIYSILLAYLLLAKNGSFWEKLFGTIVTLAITLGSSLAGAGLASMIMATNVNNTLLYQDISRLLAIILIKIIQVILFYSLAIQHFQLQK